MNPTYNIAIETFEVLPEGDRYDDLEVVLSENQLDRAIMELIDKHADDLYRIAARIVSVDIIKASDEGSLERYLCDKED